MSVLADDYDAVLLDLDGTVYRGSEVVPGAAEAIDAVRGRGVAVGFVTNNASRAPADVAQHLVALGVRADDDEVVTSSQAAARVLADRLDPASAVLVVGTQALADELVAVGLRPVRRAEDDPVAVVQGHSPETGWRDLAEATIAIRAGAWWVACNVDPTLPTERGQLPGNGSMVAAVRTATEREPVIAGKPGRPLIDAATDRLYAEHPVIVGDRLDTDIEAGADTGYDTLLVLTGVSTAADLLAAPPRRRPTYVGADLGALGVAADDLRIGPRPGWTVTREGATLVLVGQGEAYDALRALCSYRWAEPDADRGGPVAVRPGTAEAGDALDALGMDSFDTAATERR